MASLAEDSDTKVTTDEGGRIRTGSGSDWVIRGIRQ